MCNRGNVVGFSLCDLTMMVSATTDKRHKILALFHFNSMFSQIYCEAIWSIFSPVLIAMIFMPIDYKLCLT